MVRIPGVSDTEAPRGGQARLSTDTTARAHRGARLAETLDGAGYMALNVGIRRVCALVGWGRSQVGVGRSLAVVSSSAGEGTSLVARAIATCTATDIGSPVVLVECDLLHPTIAGDFAVADGPGLCGVLSSARDLTADLLNALRPSSVANLWLLPAGRHESGPPGLLRSSRMSELIEQLSVEFAFVVLDLPAVLDSSDTTVLSQRLDGVVLVVRSGATEQNLVHQALSLLASCHVHGIVVNRVRSRIPALIRKILVL